MSDRITYPDKSNNPSDPDINRKYFATEADEVKAVVNAHADDIEDHETRVSALELSQSPNPFYGRYTSLALLQAAYPVGELNAWAVIDAGAGITPQIAFWDNIGAAWEISGATDFIIYVANEAALPAPGLTQKLYVTNDKGNIYVWIGAAYLLVGGAEFATKTENDAKLPHGGYIGTGQDLANAISAIPTPTNNRVLSGGMVWDPVLEKYKSLGLIFMVNGETFAPADGTTVNHSPAPTTGTDKRIDLIYGDDTGALGIKDGTAGDPAASPTLEPNQLQIHLVFWDTNATTPTGVSKITVYEENLGSPNEATVTESTGGARIDLGSTTSPITDTKSIRTTSNLNSDDTITFTLDADVLLSEFNSIELALFVLTDWSNDYLWVSLIDGSTEVAFAVLNKNNVTVTNVVTVQNIALFSNNFNYTQGETKFNKVLIKARVLGSSTLQFQLDDIYINKDGNATSPLNFLPTGGYVGTAQDLKDEILPIITISGRPFRLRKTVNVNDPAKKSTQEINDVIEGSPADGEYIIAQYLGGDVTDFNNPIVYNIIIGI